MLICAVLMPLFAWACLVFKVEILLVFEEFLGWVRTAFTRDGWRIGVRTFCTLGVLTLAIVLVFLLLIIARVF